MKNDFSVVNWGPNRLTPHPAVPVLELEPTEHAKIILYLFDK